MKKTWIALILCNCILFGCGKPALESQPTQPESETTFVEENKSLNDEVVSSTEATQVDSSHSTEDTEEAPTLTLLMVGDILLHTPVEKCAKQADGSYDFHAIFANTKDTIAGADLALVNQEVIIGGKDLGISGYPAFNAPAEIGDALVDTGFDVVCHATNHALDKGKRGINNCLEYWEDSHPEMVTLGIHNEQPDSTIYYYEKDGIKIAILNYTYGTNGIPLPEGMPYAVDLLNEEKVIKDIQTAESEADFTIVCPHWGTEYRLTPDSMQEKWTKLFAENGVDLVLGTHPHVIEPIEWVTDETSGHEMLVYYSLGNYVNWTSGTGEGVANRMVGGMAQVTLTLDDNGQVILSDYAVEALVCHVEDATNGVTVYPLSEYTTELANQNQIRSQDSAFSLEYCTNLCDKVWPDLWH